MISANRCDDCVKSYLAFQAHQHNEPAKSHRSSLLLKDLLGLHPGFTEDYLTGSGAHPFERRDRGSLAPKQLGYQGELWQCYTDHIRSRHPARQAETVRSTD